MHNSSKPFFILCGLTYLLCTGCATITRGTTEAFVVNSKPSGANVRLSSGEICKTPCVLKKKRKDSFVVFIEKAGYEPVEIQVTNQVAGAGAAGMAGNVVLGGLIGAAVDAGSGAMLKLVPNPVEVDLVPLAPGYREEKIRKGRSQSNEEEKGTFPMTTESQDEIL